MATVRTETFRCSGRHGSSGWAADLAAAASDARAPPAADGVEVVASTKESRRKDPSPSPLDRSRVRSVEGEVGVGGCMHLI